MAPNIRGVVTLWTAVAERAQLLTGAKAEIGGERIG
jgi:hypothetical protein